MIRKKLKWFNTGLNETQLLNELQHRPSVTLRKEGMNAVFVLVNNELLAFKNKCPHQGKPMDGCWVQDGNIVCPIHRFSFDCETGRAGGLYIDKYPIRVEYGEVSIGIEKWSIF